MTSLSRTTSVLNPGGIARSVRLLQRAASSVATTAIHGARIGLTSLLIFCMVPLGVMDMCAQDVPPTGQYVQLANNDLNQLVAPIALYPDALVAQILAGSTYSPQIAEADHFVQRNIGLPPQELARLVDTQPWDPSVKALTAFPSVLSNLDRNIQWTTRLGNAYYNQPQDVMSAVQVMRQRAYEAGTLRSTPQLSVGYQPGFVVIQPVNPAVYYVPLYNPWVVYGAPIPAYPAYYYVAPPPPAGRVVAAAAIGFAAGVAVGAFTSYGWGCTHWGPNWYAHSVYYNHAVYVSRSVTVVNHGYYGAYDHSPAARAYNHQVFVGPHGGVATRTEVRGGGQTNVWGTGPNGGTYSRSTSHYAGGSSTTVTGPNGGTANHTVTGRGTGDVTSTTTGPNGGTASRSTQHSPGSTTSTATGPRGQSETTTTSGLGTGHGSVTRSGARGNRSWHHK